MKVMFVALLLLFSDLQAQQEEVSSDLCQELRMLKDTSSMAMVQCFHHFTMRLLDKFSASVNDERVSNQMTARVRYKFYREVQKNCPELSKMKEILFVYPLLDLDSVFSGAEIRALESRLFEISKKKKHWLFVVTIDDYFPYKTIGEYSDHYLDVWGPDEKRGTAIIVINKSLKEVRVIPDQKAKKYLSPEECNNVTELISAAFQPDNVYTELLRSIENIRKKKF